MYKIKTLIKKSRTILIRFNNKTIVINQYFNENLKFFIILAINNPRVRSFHLVFCEYGNL